MRAGGREPGFQARIAPPGGDCPVHRGCSPASLVSTHEMPVAPSPDCDSRNMVQTLPNAPRGAKPPCFEKHWSGTDGKQRLRCPPCRAFYDGVRQGPHRTCLEGKKPQNSVIRDYCAGFKETFYNFSPVVKALHPQGSVSCSSVLHTLNRQEVTGSALSEWQRDWSRRDQLRGWHVAAIAVIQSYKDPDTWGGRGVGRKESP